MFDPKAYRIQQARLGGRSASPFSVPAWLVEWRAAVRHLGPSDRLLTSWGGLLIMIQILFWILPGEYSTILQSYALFLFGLIFCLVMAIRRSSPFPNSFPFLMGFVLQLWSFFTALYANQHLGRPILFGRVDTYVLLDIIPGIVIYAVCKIAPGLRIIFVKALIGAFAISSAFAWLQFARFPPAVALSRIYTYKAIDNWDGHPGIRAVGLTAQPNYLGFQAVMGIALACAAVMAGPLNRKHYAYAVLFTGAALFSQSRAAFAPLAIVAVAILIYVTKRNPIQGARLIASLIASITVLLAVAGKRFEYMFMAVSGNDMSLESRKQLAWSQLEPILPKLPLTGIGPSSGLFLGTGPEDKWVQVGRPVESGYLLLQAMYGIPGVAIMGLALGGSAYLAYRGIVLSKDMLQKQLMAVGIVCAIHLALNAASFNTFDTYIHLPLAFIIAGLAVAPPEKESMVRGRWSSRLPAEIPA